MTKNRRRWWANHINYYVPLSVIRDIFKRAKWADGALGHLDAELWYRDLEITDLKLDIAEKEVATLRDRLAAALAENRRLRRELHRYSIGAMTMLSEGYRSDVVTADEFEQRCVPMAQTQSAQRILDLENKLSRQKQTIRNMQEAAEKKNLALDALHYVWCDGGCNGGAHRYHAEPVTRELVETAVHHITRLVRWFNNSEFRTLDIKDRWDYLRTVGRISEEFYYKTTGRVSSANAQVGRIALLVRTVKRLRDERALPPGWHWVRMSPPQIRAEFTVDYDDA